MSSAERQRYRARWVFPVDGEPIEDGVVEIENGLIAAVHAKRDGSADDLGNVAVIPGLVNTHTHLEFSDLRAPIEPALPFTDWIRRVVAHRRHAAADVPQAIRRGLHECRTSGTTTIAEIAAHDWPAELRRDTEARVVVFRELRALRPDGADEQLRIARSHLEQSGDGTNNVHGLSPHAPYSVHPDLFNQLIDLAHEFSAPLAVHLAETRAELQLLADRSGEFVPLLQEFGVWNHSALPGKVRPLDYLRQLAKLDHAIVAHGNYLSDEEVAFLTTNRHLAVAFCPRTHAFFRHSTHPWKQMLDAGCTVAIGTDSRASNPDLSVWKEVQFLWSRNCDVSPQSLLAMATIHGARALGLDDRTGSLAAGKSADLAVVELPTSSSGDPHANLFDASTRPIRTMYAGRWDKSVI